MELCQFGSVEELVRHLVDGPAAADPLVPMDDVRLIGLLDVYQSMCRLHGGIASALIETTGAAYSLGARHALERSPERHVASNVIAADEEDVDLSAPLLPPPAMGGVRHVQ